MIEFDAQSMAVADLLIRAEVVLVAYRSRDHVAELLANWPQELAVVVVDNSADVDGLAALVRQYPQARYVDGGGQGFARGANLGAAGSEREFLIFVNPDCRPSAEDLSALVNGLDHDPGALAHAATMTRHDGSVEVGVGGWEPSIRRLVVHALGLDKRWQAAGLFAQPRIGEHCAVDWLTGACMAVRARTFAEIGGFDETFFVYAEDVSFGRLGRQRGLRPVLRDDVLVRHGAGNSGAPSHEMLRLRGASFAGYLTRYHSTVPALAMRGLMVLGAGLRAGRSLAQGNLTAARLDLAFIVGLVTRRARVGDREVAAARYREVVGSPA